MCFQRGVQAGEEIVRLNALKEAPVFVEENEIAPDELWEILLRGWVLRKAELLHLEVVKQNIDQLGIVAVKVIRDTPASFVTSVTVMSERLFASIRRKSACCIQVRTSRFWWLTWVFMIQFLASCNS